MKSFALLIFLFLFNLTLFAQISFQKAYGGGSVEGSWCVKQTSDMGYIITAESLSFDPGGNDLYIVKTDSLGSLEWTKTFGASPFLEYGNYVIETFDGGYISLGRAESFGFGSSDFYLIKMDSVGNMLWSKTYGGPSYEEGYSMAQTADSGFVLAGYTESFGSGQSDLWVIKTDTSGNIEWTKTYGGTGTEGISGFGNISIHQIYDDGFVLAGYTNSFGAGSFDFYLLRIDSIGNLDWSKTYGGAGIDYGYGNSVGRTDDGGYIITGHTESFGAGMSDVYVVKADSVGTLEWSRTFGGSDVDYGYSIQQTSDFGYIIGGATASFGNGGFDAYLLKIDVNGELMWSRAIGGSQDDYAFSVDQTADEGYILTGYTSSFGSGSSDVYLVKTDALGNAPCNSISAPTLVSNPPTITNSPATIIGAGGNSMVPPTVSFSGGTETNGCGSLWGTASISDATCSIVCNGEITAIPSGGAPPYSYQWNDPQLQTTSMATGLCGGFYSCTITDVLGAQFLIYGFVTDTNAITTSTSTIGTTGTTGAATTTPTGGTPPYTYQWDDPLNQTDSTAINLSPGIYTVIITDSNGCEITDVVEVADVTGLSEFEFDLTVLPNPFSDLIQIIYNGEDAFHIELIDAFGRVLFVGDSQSTINTEKLSPGSYILRIYNGHFDHRRKVIKSQI